MFVSKYNSIIDYDYIVNTPEGMYFDRKAFEIRPKDIANTIIGMANASGGTIAVGIKDKKLQKCTISNERYNDLLQVLHNHISPIPQVRIEEISLDDRSDSIENNIVLYHIENDFEQVYKRSDNGHVYLRIGDETRQLNPEQANNLEYDKGTRKFEELPCKNFDEKDIRSTLADYYKDKLKYKGDFRELLVSRGLATKEGENIVYKNSAVLLFSENPDKYIPSTYIRYVKYEGEHQGVGAKYNVIKDETFYGPIPLLIEKVLRFLEQNFSEYFYLDIDDGKFKSTLEYPKEAWLEGVVNALTHRSYNRQGNPIQIFHYDNRLEIHNPGPLPSNVTVDNIKDTRYSRNPRIARVLNELDYVRELNEGVKRIFSSMEETLLGKPIYKDEKAIVSLILQNNVKNHIKTLGSSSFEKISRKFASFSPIEKDIILFMLKEGKAKTSDLVEHLSKSHVTVRGYLKNLEEMGILKKNAKSPRDPSAYYSF